MTPEIKLHLAQLISDLSSAQKTVDKLEQLGYKQKTVKQNIEFLIDELLEQVEYQKECESGVFIKWHDPKLVKIQ